MEPTLEDFKILETIQDEINIRNTVLTKPYVIYYKSIDQTDELQIVNPGCAGLFVGYENDPFLIALKEAVESENHNAIKLLALQLRENAALLENVDLNTAVTDMYKKSSFAELQYHRKSLIKNLFVPDNALICPWALPYIGGAINKNDFDFIQYTSNLNENLLTALIIINEPNLSLKEIDILEKISVTNTSLQIGTAICWGLSAVTLAIAVSGATGVCCPHDGLSDQTGWTDPSPEWLANLDDDPIIAARDLLKFRRENISKK